MRARAAAIASSSRSWVSSWVCAAVWVMFLDLDRKSWRKRGMNALCHYDAGPPVKTRFTTFAAAGFAVETCPEAEDRRLAPGPRFGFTSSSRCTAGLIDAPRLKLVRHLCDGTRGCASAWFEEAAQALKSASFD